jgi:predicted nucleic acid-binding Zn ribbon protein
MFTLGRYVNDAVKGLNAQKAIEFHRLKEAWLQAVGPILAGQAEPTRLRGSVLHVTVSSPAWSQEIQMQQRLILSRLKGTLRAAPTKIVCWVGQPHLNVPRPGKSSGVSASEQVPWAATSIPEHRQAAIEATLAALSEETQRAKIRPLIELAVRRELYYLELGQLPCPVCGAMRPAEEDSCRACQRERLEQAERRLMRVMAKRPWLKIRDLQDLAPWAGRAHLLRLRKALHTDLLQQAWQLSEGTEGDELTARMTPAYRQLLLSVTMLRCYLPPDSLKPFHFHHALGKRLGTAYLASLAVPKDKVRD